MTPAKQAGLWLIHFLSFLLIFSASYLFLPEIYLYRRFSDLVGFITEQAWNDLFMLAILGASVIINTLLIYIVATLRNRQA
ncbi:MULTISPECIES: hypothetical protein [unclassified Leclercia]|uniref:Uncharacterized protein n=1 Tax=Leclercia barmai TaxID=2785629 RepID=A0ABS7RSX3_9ENTR|nr:MULTISPECIES: hypothetical protein [unclassified Leclercia]MBZ0056900.1 hypothetical protein [Leclercia sp. EMC7]MCM5694855.1 hypothetical protein [Leclercia sp. LTM01]MCM5698761.1 hypothetical protein [Leclercia sp. LTM14]